jgi:type IV pilus assembly protein PilA
MAGSRHTGRGFTLIEMMIVVVIVGVLAALAVAGYRKLITSSHITEATQMVTNIRVAQEGYHSETLHYANVSASLTSYYPNGSPTGNVVTQWGAQCTSQCSGSGMDWSLLPVHVDGPVAFGYATIASPATPPSGVSVNGTTVTLTAPSDWYVIAAHCDMDSKGGLTTTMYGLSWTNQMFVDHEGQ